MKTIVAGTFDRLHRGHRSLIESAKRLGEVACGLTTDEFASALEKVRPEIILPYEKRRAELEEEAVDEIHPISDKVGFALDPSFEAIVVTKETRPAAEKINKERRERGTRPLLIVEMPLVLAEDGLPISSGRIRQGIIDRRGRVKAVAPKTKSQIRKNMISLLKEHGELYGYRLQKLYEREFEPISLRLVYYHLARGIEEGLFHAESRVEEKGCSWGSRVERKYYTLAFTPGPPD